MYADAREIIPEQDDPLFQITVVWESLRRAALDAGLCETPAEQPCEPEA